MLPILLAVIFILVIFIVVIAGRPDEFIVSRSANIAAPPDKIYPQVNDLHNWKVWSPWAKLDPGAKTSYSGATAGVGSAMAWDGNNKIGAGKMTITESDPGKLIRLRLDFEKPMKATNTAEFTFRPAGGQTVVTWRMAGKNTFMGKCFALFVNFDKMIGCQFEKGLISLKSLTEQ